jgi:hypothetical protein
MLDPDRLTGLGLFDPTTVHRMLRAHDEHRADNAWGLWTILSMTLWQERLRNEQHWTSPTLPPRS